MLVTRTAAELRPSQQSAKRLALALSVLLEEREVFVLLRVIYRDLKPTNVLLDDDGDAYLSACGRRPNK